MLSKTYVKKMNENMNLQKFYVHINRLKKIIFDKIITFALFRRLKSKNKTIKPITFCIPIHEI